MTLYKYIDFSNPYWAEPWLEKKLYFSSPSQLRNVNDQEEFNHEWTSSSYFFTKYSKDLSDPYDKLFSVSRVLCLSQSLNKRCWDTFCSSGQGGVCYEFDYDETEKRQDITSGSIVYSNTKTLNVPAYIINQLTDEKIRTLLSK
jgi:hypothetical protein